MDTLPALHDDLHDKRRRFTEDEKVELGAEREGKRRGDSCTRLRP